VAVVAALADVDVAPGQLQRRVGLEALDRLRGAERWKNSGTISTRPPTATASRISTIIRKLLVSIFS
jgi:hypothetical protein